MSQNVTVIGAGSWGTALSTVLIDNNHDVLLWSRNDEQVAEINKYHTNKDYLSDTKLPTELKATSDLEKAVKHAKVLLFVVPTGAIRPVAKQVAAYMSEEKVIIHAAKGLEIDTRLRISEILKEELPNDKIEGVVALSGPSHAEEVVKHDITSITSASEDERLAKFVQQLFINDYFRIYTNPDIIGVEIGAALKNIIALGSGILSGYGYGDNAKAALITRGLAEITRFGEKINANPITFLGLSGVGDLIVTCASTHSRNFQAGHYIGSGYSLEETLEKIGMVVEGVYTTRAANELAEELQVEMPITSAIYHVLYENVSVEEAITKLMNREGKSELEYFLTISK